MLDPTKNYLQTYRSFANSSKAIIMGHILKGDPKRARKLNRSSLRHAYHIMKLFFLKPQEKISELTVDFRGKKQKIKTDEYGFFQAEIDISETLKPGWHHYHIYFSQAEIESGIFIKPCSTSYGIISDIDDTYLISHSSNAVKKLGVMLFRNVTKRKPFQDAVKHYRYLFNYQTENGAKNAFFNVSSSEWNLYPLLTNFLSFNDFPNAVLLLDTLKSGLIDLLSSGRGSHNHKLHKIETILSYYPDRKFILIGDDTQRDPYIYREIVRKHPESIAFVQIRQVGKEKKPIIDSLLRDVPVPTHYFESSEQAIEWTKELVQT